MKLFKKSLFAVIALGASIAFAGNGDVESGGIKSITCSGLDNSQKPVQVRVQNIQPFGIVSADGTLYRYEGKPWQAVLRVATEKRATTLCKSASVAGWVSKRSPLVVSLAGDILVECDGNSSDGSYFKGDYFLRLEKKGAGLYEGDFCGGDVQTIGGVDIDHDCVWGLTCIAN